MKVSWTKGITAVVTTISLVLSIPAVSATAAVENETIGLSSQKTAAAVLSSSSSSVTKDTTLLRGSSSASSAALLLKKQQQQQQQQQPQPHNNNNNDSTQASPQQQQQQQRALHMVDVTQLECTTQRDADPNEDLVCRFRISREELERDGHLDDGAHIWFTADVITVAPAATASGVNNQATTVSPPMAATTVAPTFIPTTPDGSEDAVVCGNLTSPQRSELILGQLATYTASELLLEPGTAQHRAVHWLLQEDAQHVCPDEFLNVQQRYILAVLYYGTQGDDWTHCNAATSKPVVTPCPPGVEQFLAPSDVCTWFGISCNNKNRVTGISIGVDGPLPDELGYLEQLEAVDFNATAVLPVIPISPTDSNGNKTSYDIISYPLPSEVLNNSSAPVVSLATASPTAAPVTVSNVKETTPDAVSNVKETTQDAVSNVKETTLDAMSNVQETTLDAVSNVKNGVAPVIEEATTEEVSTTTTTAATWSPMKVVPSTEAPVAATAVPVISKTATAAPTISPSEAPVTRPPTLAPVVPITIAPITAEPIPIPIAAEVVPVVEEASIEEFETFISTVPTVRHPPGVEGPCYIMPANSICFLNVGRCMDVFGRINDVCCPRCATSTYRPGDTCDVTLPNPAECIREVFIGHNGNDPETPATTTTATNEAITESGLFDEAETEDVEVEVVAASSSSSTSSSLSSGWSSSTPDGYSGAATSNGLRPEAESGKTGTGQRCTSSSDCILTTFCSSNKICISMGSCKENPDCTNPSNLWGAEPCIVSSSSIPVHTVLLHCTTHVNIRTHIHLLIFLPQNSTQS